VRISKSSVFFSKVNEGVWSSLIEVRIEIKLLCSDSLLHAENFPGNFARASVDGMNEKARCPVVESERQARKFSEFLFLIELTRFVRTFVAVVGGKKPERPVSGGSGVRVENKSQPNNKIEIENNI